MSIECSVAVSSLSYDIWAVAYLNVVMVDDGTRPCLTIAKKIVQIAHGRLSKILNYDVVSCCVCFVGWKRHLSTSVDMTKRQEYIPRTIL